MTHDIHNNYQNNYNSYLSIDSILAYRPLNNQFISIYYQKQILIKLHYD